MAGKFWTAAVLVSALISLSGAAAEPRRCYWCGPLAEQVHRSRRSALCGASDHVTVCEPGYNYCAIVATSPPRVESRYCVKMYQDECYPLFCNSTKTWKVTCPCRGDLCNGPNTARETEAFALLPKLVAKTNNARIKKRTAIASPHLIKHEGKTKSNITSEKRIVNEDDNSSHPSDNIQSDQSTNIVVEHHVEIENDALNATNENSRQSTTANYQLIEIEIHVSDPTEGPINGKENVQPCTTSPSTPEHDHPTNITEPLNQEESPIATTTETNQDNPPKTTQNTNENPITTEAEQQNEAEVSTTNAPLELSTIENNAEKTPNDELEKPVETVNNTATTIISTLKTEEEEVEEPGKVAEPVDQMQNDAPHSVDSSQSVITTASTMIIQSTFKSGVDHLGAHEGSVDQMQNDAPIDSVQAGSTTATTLIQQTTLNDEVKPSKEMPTAEALQQNGSPAKVTEKTIQPTTNEATTVTTVVSTTKNVVTMTTPPSRRKNNTSRIYFSYILLISYFVFLLV